MSDEIIVATTTDEQKAFLEAHGYDIKADMRTAMSKQRKLEREREQVGRLQQVIQQRQSAIEEERERLFESYRQKQERLRAKLGQQEEEAAGRWEALQLKQQRAQNNREAFRQMHEAARRDRMRQIAEEDRKTAQLMDRRYKERLAALELLREKDRQIEMKRGLAEQLKRFREQRALDNWLAYRECVRALEGQAYRGRVQNMARLFHGGG